MNFLGNIIWFLLGGFLTALMYIIGGLVMCITIIGIPFGLQIISLGILAICPFGREVRTNPTSGCLTTGFNVLWIIFGWWEIAQTHLVFGAILCITIIGIPLGTQHFKLAKYSLFPFGCIIR